MRCDRFHLPIGRLVVLSAVALAGCDLIGGRGTRSGRTTRDDEATPGRPLAGIELLFPDNGASVPLGEVEFRWSTPGSEAGTLDNAIYVSDRPEVFSELLTTQRVQTEAGETEHRARITLSRAGTFYWGVEINDGVNTVRVPADGIGIPFDVGRAGIDGLVLLCPAAAQPSRAATTFHWALADLAPLRTSVFVSRAEQGSAFDSPLRVFEVEPATAGFRALSDQEALPLNTPLIWGLRIETADAVLFSSQEQAPGSFVAGENVRPSGALLGPDDGAVLADNTARFDLRWQADDGNCEDQLNSTVFLAPLAGGDPATDLFDSPLRLVIADGSREVDLVARLGELNLAGGRWAWGVQADDGTDRTQLAATTASDATFRMFVRDTRPRFVQAPTIGPRNCAAQETPTAALSFAYQDDNGAQSVTVTLSYSQTASDVFTQPGARLVLGAAQPSVSAVEASNFVSADDSEGCAGFHHGPGFYGVELDDRINEPVRATVEYAGPDCDQDGIADAEATSGTAGDCDGNGLPDRCEVLAGAAVDCNGNFVPDSCDIALQTSRDCDHNGVPDECQPDCNHNGIPDVCDPYDCAPPLLDCNANGVLDSQDIDNGTSADVNRNGVPDECDGPAIVAANPPRVNPYGAGVFRDVLQNTTDGLVPQGIGAPGTPDEGPVAYIPIRVTFSSTPMPAPAPDTISVVCTDIRANGPADCPSVTAVAGSGAGPYLLSLGGPVPVRECTTFTFEGARPGEKLQYQSLPGDVNLNGSVTGQDVVVLITVLNDGTGNTPQNLARFDINRNGVVTAQDLVRLVLLFNGSAATQSFNNVTVAACP